MIEPFFFGPNNRQIFGTFHPSVGGEATGLTVICPPLFLDYMRVHPALRALAILLAQRGHDVLRFDYFGTGDSFGDLCSVALSDWIEDIVMALREGRDLSNSSAAQVVGVRAGALLACRALGSSSDVRRFVLWDPVSNGASYLQELRHIQAKLIAESRGDRREAADEYAGSRLSDRMVQDLHSLDESAYSNIPKTKLSIVRTSSVVDFPLIADLVQDKVEFNCDWQTPTADRLMPRIVLETLTSCLTKP